MFETRVLQINTYRYIPKFSTTVVLFFKWISFNDKYYILNIFSVYLV